MSKQSEAQYEQIFDNVKRAVGRIAAAASWNLPADRKRTMFQHLRDYSSTCLETLEGAEEANRLARRIIESAKEDEIAMRERTATDSPNAVDGTSR